MGQRYAEPEVGRVTQVWLLVHMTGYGYSYTGHNGYWVNRTNRGGGRDVKDVWEQV